MREEEKVLKAIYGLVKGDKSPVHLPVSPVTVSQGMEMPLERVLACCRVLESHGYLLSSKGLMGNQYYYITKTGIAEAQNPSLPLYLLSGTIPPSLGRRS
ncbi:hypothetical protein EFA69_05180 [Rufibacter immobilis]|uniref:Uncharacterized protein n=1 Tax=Rufibacter immobilis TaxID=1348778 RepID=A0A3M9N290_9BACT|nr:hypothetical protein [Rufibacter immobilis]RNI31904.1 hypothetical protein EFA69_05180 [Rufibacter immobilis]